MTPLSASQPFKGIYILLVLVKTPVYLTLLSLRYASRSLRPVPEWSFKTSLATAWFRAFFSFATATRSQRPRQLEPGKSKERFVLMQPPDADYFCGVLAATSIIRPAPVGAIWHPSAVQKGESGRQKIVLQFAGGAFVLGWDPEQAGQGVAETLTRHFQATHTLYVQCRLAGAATHFPAALQDALTAYHYVLSLGVRADDIILSGDSSGGNLVLGLLRYLEMSQTQLPLPGGAMLWSPWVHVPRNAKQDYTTSPNSDVDILVGSLLEWGANAYMPEGDLPRDVQAFISPLHHPFSTTTPLFIQAGTREAFYDKIKLFAREMADVKGNRVRFHESQLAPHDIFLTHSVLGLTQQAEADVSDACTFLEDAI
ncbi:hypothetical protein SLS62_000474 [Diatrype stigma]|uniref:Alpha/beta hydrolase fold-3 domain-containing protein n=1 Tax=Diatrype stigma TaxID=117547 RepID=A0AAN9YWW9_9PEZI